MATLEHFCTECDYQRFDNFPGPKDEVCPKCGGEIRQSWDEYPDSDELDVLADDDPDYGMLDDEGEADG